MIRRLLVALLAGIMALATLLVLTANYLPWWGFLLTLLGVAVGLWATVRLLTGRLLERLFSMPFRAKGAVLHGARAEVHSVVPAQRPAGDADTDGVENAKLTCYDVDLTITPRQRSGAFQHWEPGELLLVPANARCDRISDEPEGAKVLGVEVFGEGRFGPDEGMKYFGPQRLRVRVGVLPGGERSLAFRYYFEKFGTLTLPPEGGGAGEREGEGRGEAARRSDRDRDREPDRTRS